MSTRKKKPQPQGDLVELPIGEPVANPRNPRLHPEEQIAMLAESIRHFGQPRPILVRAENRMIVAGHGVLQACQRAGRKTVQAMLWDVDQATADAYMLADNQHGQNSSDDLGRVADLLREVHDVDFAALGFLREDADKLLKGASEDELRVVAIATTPARDRFWISVRGPLAHQAAALAHLRELMKATPDIEVELGTVAEG